MTDTREIQSGAIAEKAALNGTAFTNGLSRFLNCESDGHIDAVDASGTAVIDYPVHKGYNPVKFDKIDAPTTGSAPTSVWGGW